MARARASRIVFNPAGFLQANQSRLAGAAAKTRVFDQIGQNALNLASLVVNKRETKRREKRQDDDTARRERRQDSLREDALELRATERAQDFITSERRHRENVGLREADDERANEALAHRKGLGAIESLKGRVSKADELIATLRLGMVGRDPTNVDVGMMEEAVRRRNSAYGSLQAKQQEVHGVAPDGRVMDPQRALASAEMTAAMNRQSPLKTIQDVEKLRSNAELRLDEANRALTKLKRGTDAYANARDMAVKAARDIKFANDEETRIGKQVKAQGEQAQQEAINKSIEKATTIITEAKIPSGKELGVLNQYKDDLKRGVPEKKALANMRGRLDKIKGEGETKSNDDLVKKVEGLALTVVGNEETPFIINEGLMPAERIRLRNLDPNLFTPGARRRMREQGIVNPSTRVPAGPPREAAGASVPARPSRAEVTDEVRAMQKKNPGMLRSEIRAFLQDKCGDPEGKG